MRILAHISDLHIGSLGSRRRAESLCALLLGRRVDHVVATGDLTDRGRQQELAEFRRIFAPLIDEGRMTVVPGNHDCLGDGVASELMAGGRVQVVTVPGLRIVRLDSTAAHNRSWVRGHGTLDERDVDAVSAALAEAPADGERRLTVLLLHHHLLPLPHDHIIERMLTWLGRPWALELRTGARLLEAIRGRCDLVLHGHRHRPGRITAFPADARPVVLFNAGSSTQLMAARLFAHGQGRLLGPPGWAAAEAVVAPHEHVAVFNPGSDRDTSQAAAAALAT